MTNEEGIHASLHPGFQDCRPVLVDEPKSCCTVLMEACKKSYVPSVLTILIYLLATAVIIIAMIFEDITIPRLLTGMLGLVIYIVVVFSVYFDLRRESQPQPDGDQRLLITQLKKVLFAKIKYHAIITWLSIVMIFTTPIADPDVLSIELVAVFVLMFVVIMLGVHAQTTNARLPGARV
ncbi:hypothetical protein L5515_005171 [Caenorhabditis briggsae]|uniref:Uncharacterized protein n=1 Tax=Caenorhabditis briggsae TaxID=6238 RepID=A0AAE9JEJ8_CAEBR|nr:hypothetical protein L5515_005171 [Caenorhabditis briggsae]